MEQYSNYKGVAGNMKHVNKMGWAWIKLAVFNPECNFLSPENYSH